MCVCVCVCVGGVARCEGQGGEWWVVINHGESRSPPTELLVPYC